MATALRRIAFLLALGSSPAIAAPAVAPSPVHAPARAILFGVQVGSPLTLPRCPGDNLGVSDALQELPSMCWAGQPADVKGVPYVGDVEVHFASGNRPAFISGDIGFITVTLAHGVVDEIHVFTDGVRSQDDVRSQLVAKLGNPTSSETEKASNLMGASFDVEHCAWHLPSGDVVEFGGATDEFTTGYITAMSPEAALAAQKADSAAPAL